MKNSEGRELVIPRPHLTKGKVSFQWLRLLYHPFEPRNAAYLKVSEAASLYGVCDQTIRNLVESRDLQAVRTSGGRRRIPLTSLRSYFEGLSQDEQEG